MARMMARTPKASYDRHTGRFLINWRFPKAVQTLTGPFFRDRFPRNLTPEQAARREVQKLSEFHALIDDAHARLGTPDGRCEVLLREREVLLGQRATVDAEITTVEARIGSLIKIRDLLHSSQEIGLTLPAEQLVAQLGIIATPPADTEAVIKAWIDERNSEDNAPKEKAIKTKQRVLAHMLAATGRRHIGEVTEADLRTYRGKLVAEGKAYDYLVELKPLFKTAKANGLINVNPIAEIELPKKVRDRRPPFSDCEAKLILDAASAAEPAIRWPNLLAAFTGMINSEIFEADASEVYETESGWVFDMRGRKLKTGFRPRVLPLHPAIIDAGFAEYVASRTGQKLFDGTCDNNTNRVNLFIHGLGIDKSFYSWRHRVLYALDKLIKAGLTTESLNRFIAGHAGSNIAQKHYHHHDLPEEFAEIVRAIGGLRDPAKKA